ncbi:MAG: hypothetical protein ACRDUA_20100, partial [Micromonosporaceae bacterium]
THVVLGSETTVKLRPTEARVVLIDVDGPIHRFDLTFRTVPAVDRVMAALADIRAALLAPAAVQTRHCSLTGRKAVS